MSREKTDRRAFLAAGLVGGAALISGAKADTAKAYRDYTQAELDASMDQTRWAPNMHAVLEKWKPQSEKARQTLTSRSVAYGAAQYQEVEVFPSRDGAPIVFFIHGGEWKRPGNDTSAFPALSLVPAGCAFVNVGFRAAPQFKLTDMADDVRQALIWTYRNASSFGGDSGKIFVVGHSSGAHLGGVMLTTDWKAHGLPGNPIRGAVLFSGLYDLEPVLISMRREWVKLSPDEALALSPVRHVAGVTTPTIVACGANDSPEFRRQSQEFGTALASRSAGCRFVQAPDLNHFEVPQTFVDADGVATKVVLEQIGKA
ncbi:alpha/beta hydrolase [Bradyrhizobium sp. NP1]|uniref:alpha/beta hydrolase n=1 Tax=Bradyrhizobium sp. NP1 TaxID=3049772 RepID=UPI0025A4DD41|nr:alpha/beta hydrolase [Bradyrhizobium sp. NP1]WJR75232.1 alpha/beta hydrolase [Bradyrhizobium sp. NP1]